MAFKGEYVLSAIQWNINVFFPRVLSVMYYYLLVIILRIYLKLVNKKKCFMLVLMFLCDIRYLCDILPILSICSCICVRHLVSGALFLVRVYRTYDTVTLANDRLFSLKCIVAQINIYGRRVLIVL